MPEWLSPGSSQYCEKMDAAAPGSIRLVLPKRPPPQACLSIPWKAAWTSGGMKRRENARPMSPTPKFFFATSFLFFVAKFFFAKAGALSGNERAGYPAIGLNLWNCHFICAKNHM
ncbi:hypothetical protein ACR42D_07585 [Desulfovibrio caledoniensis]